VWGFSGDVGTKGAIASQKCGLRGSIPLSPPTRKYVCLYKHFQIINKRDFNISLNILTFLYEKGDM
jgi:hypothetical protein